MGKFENMIMGARKADIDSIRELKNYIYEKSGVANKSLRALERSGYTEYAYGNAMEFLNTTYQSIKFPQAVANRPTSDLIQQALFLENWLGLPTRTVTGAKHAWKATQEGLKRLEELGYNIPTDREKFMRIVKVIARTGVDLADSIKYLTWESIDQAFENGWTEEEVEENLLRWQADDISYSHMTSLFRGGEYIL